MSLALPLISNTDIDAAKKLIVSANLRFEEIYDLLVGVFHNSKLVGCGARHGRVLKMLVIDAEFRGGDLLGEIVTELVSGDQSFKTGGHFIFAKPCAIASFERLNFSLLVRHPTLGLGLLENQNGLNQFFRQNVASVQSGRNGAVVINSDPFSLGHLYLIEQAATQVDNLYVFVPGEGSFMLSPEVRITLAREGSRHLSNVRVINSGPYVLSDTCFPGYFLKPDESKEQVRMEMDTELFGQHLAPFFHVVTRFVGTEPLDPGERTHNQVLKRRLAELDIRLVEINRKKVGDLWIDTHNIQRAIKAGETEDLRALVPVTTFDYLTAELENLQYSIGRNDRRGDYSNA